MSRLVGWWIVATLLLSVLAMLLPLPQVLKGCKPYWPLLVMLYWILANGDRITLGLAFTIGLVADLLDGILLGGQALRLTIMVFTALHFRSRLRFFPMGQQTLVVLVFLLGDRCIQLLVHLFAGSVWPPLAWWISPLTGAALWPFLFFFLHHIRIRLRLQ